MGALFLGVAGDGMLAVDGERTSLRLGQPSFVPAGASRAAYSVSEEFAYLTVHRRRGTSPETCRQGRQSK